MPSSDSPLPSPANVPIESRKTALLKMLFEAYSDGRIGTPQERLAALYDAKVGDRLRERMKGLPLTEMSSIYYRVVKGEDPEVILLDVENATP